jgi:CspA family cold shock protein
MTKPDEATATKLTGVVKWWNENKGYGFISMDDCRDIFAHISQVPDESDYPQKGDAVTFIEDRGRDGRPYARSIVVVK